MQKRIRLIILAIIMTFAFSQLAMASYPTISNKESTSAKPKFEIYTPQLNGLDNGDVQSIINKSLSTMPENMLKEYREATRYIDKEISENDRSTALLKALVLMVNYDVKMLNKNTFSIVQQGYMYTGGAHGITTTLAKTFNLKTGAQYSLADLFDKDNYVQELNVIIRKEIINRGKQNVYHFNGLQNDQQFFVTKEGLFILFQQYEIAPYSEGIINFFIPYSQLNGFKSDIAYGF